MKIFGKTLGEYIWPIKYYIAASVLIVISQYYVGLQISSTFPFFINITQWAWELAVAISAAILVFKHKFNMRQILFMGILYSFIIHGLKAFFFRVFLFPYSLPAEQVQGQLIGKFLYGSSIVMAIAIGIGFICILAREGKLK